MVVEVAFLVLMGLVLMFGFVLLFGAPYLPTHKPQVKRALQLLDLPAGSTIYELGCGGGVFLRAGAREGYRMVGYEINPLLWLISWLSTRRYGNQVTVGLKSFWSADLSRADGVYVFLLGRFMARLERKLVAELSPGTKVVSYAFALPTQVLHQEIEGLYLYKIT